MLRAVILDFDFTLADSSAGVLSCINFALQEMGFPQISPERAAATIGLSLAETLATLTGVRDGDQAATFARLFVQQADRVMEPLTHIYDAVPRTIAALRARGLFLGIVSTKFRYRIENILRQHGLAGRFDVIVGGEDVAAHKPDPAGLLLALSRLDVRPAQALYVGDHIVDAETARRAGVPFVAVLSGTCREDAFQGHAALALIDGVGELLRVPGLAGLAQR